MQQNITFFRATQILILSAFFMGLACVKKRADMDAQGSNLQSLVSINEVSAWKHKITTGKEFSLGSVTKAKSLVVKEEELRKWNIKFPKIVKFETDAPLLKSSKNALDFYGEPEKKYDVVYELTPNFLKIFKLIPSSDLSHYERPYAQSKGKDWLVPLGGYNVTFFNVAYSKDSDGRNLNVKNKFLVERENFKTATHIEINSEGFIPFKRESKTDVLPVDYFLEGQWYFSSGIISKKPEEVDGQVGYIDGIQGSGSKDSATMIKFTKLEGFLRATNVVRDERVKVDEDQADLVFTIPSEWHQYRQSPSGTETKLEEESNNEIHYLNRNFAEISFASIISSVSSATERANGEIALESLNISKDSFSFTILKTREGIKHKFSFLRATDRDYQDRVYFKDDITIFGNFGVDKFKLTDLNDYREKDYEKNKLLSRFNPKKDIVFKFSNQTHKYIPGKTNDGFHNINLRQAARNCVKAWDRAFKLAGTGMNIILDESEDAELGAVETNIINVLQVFSDAGDTGVGPSVSDPLTGETISATTNVYISNGFVAGRAEKIREFIQVESGRVKNVNLLNPDGKRLPILNLVSKEVREYCPDVVQYAKSIKSNHSITTEEENQYVIPCAEKIMFKRAQSNICHEMGHNFGLRHNFYCSADDKNILKSVGELESLYPKANFPEVHEFYPNNNMLPKMSCLMDYGDWSEFHTPAVPMLSDIAGIAYIYSGKLIKNIDFNQSSGAKLNLVKFNTNQSLENQEVYKSSRKFKYCTDEHTSGRGKSIDPMCDMGDTGATPVEKIEYLFKEVREAIILKGQKLDRPYAWPSDTLAKVTASYLNNIAALYGTWRAYLSDRTQDPNLERFTDASLRATFQSLRKDEDFLGKDYVGVSELYYEVMSSLMFMPEYYCVGVANEVPYAFDFSNLQKEIVANGKTYIVQGCDDPQVAKHLSDKYSHEYLGSVGSPSESIRYTLDPLDLRESADMTGVAGIKSIATAFLTTRLSAAMSFPMTIRDSSPSAVDEPYVFDMFLEDMRSRYLDGLKLNSDMKKLFTSKGIDYKDVEPVQVYALEAPYYINSLLLLLVGAQGYPPGLKVIKGGNFAWSPRADDLAVKFYNSQTLVEQDKETYSVQGVLVQAKIPGGTAELFLKEYIAVSDVLKNISALSPTELRELSAKQNMLVQLIGKFPQL